MKIQSDLYGDIQLTQKRSKKNGISTNIDQRAALTAQVTGADKNGRESDLENTMLASLGMENTLRELNGYSVNHFKTFLTAGNFQINSRHIHYMYMLVKS